MHRHIALAVAASTLLACGAADQRDHQSEWRDVLRHKKAASSPAAPRNARQVYADALSAFVQNHPRHSRAREVYQRIQLEFANDLAAVGRYQDAIRVYRAVLSADPQNDAARRGLTAAADRLAVTHEKLLQVSIGMSRKEVAHLLGKPIPGWTVKKERTSATIEAWYYRTTGGGLAAVYFRDGEVFAAEEKSQARVAL